MIYVTGNPALIAIANSLLDGEGIDYLVKGDGRARLLLADLKAADVSDSPTRLKRPKSITGSGDQKQCLEKTTL